METVAYKKATVSFVFRPLQESEGCRVDAQNQRWRHLRPRGGSGKDTHHVYGCLRDEAIGTGKQADDYRTKGKRIRHCRYL